MNPLTTETSTATTPDSARLPRDRRVGIVVVNYGSSDLLASNLARVASEAAAHPDLPEPVVVVVDNPTDETERAAVRELCQRHGWILETPPTNIGFGAGANLGATAALEAGAGILLMLNPDAYVDARSLARLADVVTAEPMTLAAPVITTSTGEVWFDGAGVETATGAMTGSDRMHEPGVEPWLTGACLAASAHLWTTVGGFDDDYFLYWEDVDLSRRVREAGGALRVVADASAVHDEGGTQGLDQRSRAKSQTYYYYNIRNRMLYAAKFLTPAARRRWLLASVPEAWAVLLRGGRRQFVQSRQPLVTAAKAVADGAATRTGTRGSGGRLARAGTSRAISSNTTSGAGVQTRPLRVLQSYSTPLEFHNPYVKLMDSSLEASGRAEVLHFSWRNALLGDYDVLHVHWPEDVFDATTPLKAAGKRVTMALWLARLAARRTAIVRTVHNLDLPSGMDQVKRRLILALDTMTTYRVLISETTPRPDGPHGIVLHGHYIDWLADQPRSQQVPGRIAYFGLVRRYKNVEALAQAFAQTRDTHPEWSLTISGRPSSDDLVASIEAIIDGDPRVTTTLRYLTDAEVVADVTACELVVLPYKEMHNSGSLLTTLSLGRPALVPENATNRAVADEVGPGWVHFYSGELAASDLERVMDDLRENPPTGAPDLSRRDWDVSAAGHLAAYEAALAITHRR
ncbi:MAG: glycosyltransferase [Dermatophilus congolensis]|nr:glycosyltransferase [Dermatophilus congolensis]